MSILTKYYPNYILVDNDRMEGYSIKNSKVRNYNVCPFITVINPIYFFSRYVLKNLWKFDKNEFFSILTLSKLFIKSIQNT